MLNPTFHFLDNKNVQQELCTQFPINISKNVFEKTKTPYFLINLDLGNETAFNLHGKELTLIEHHINVPKSKDPKTKAFYHYTMLLQDNKKQNYKVHVYFGKRDDIVIESKLFAIDKTTNKPTTSFEMNNQDKDIIYYFALSQTALIMFLRKKQKEQISALSQQVQDTEEKLVDLSRDLKKNKKAYLALAQVQIHTINLLTQIGCQTYTPSLLGYKKMINLLSNSPDIKAKTKAQEPKRKDATEHPAIEGNEYKNTTEQVTLAPKKKRRPKKKPTTTTASFNVEELTTLLQENNKLITLFDQTQDLSTIEQAHIIAMFNNLRTCNDFILIGESDSLAKVLEQKTAISNRLKMFFRSCDLHLYGELVVHAIITNLLPLNDDLISVIVEYDYADLLNLLINADLINEATKYECATEEGVFLTIIELCVHYDSTKCFATLMNSGYSLGYIDDVDSPLFEALETPTSHPEIIESCMALKANAHFELSMKVCQSLRNKRAKTQDKEEAELIDIKLDIITYMEKIRKYLNENPVLKYSISEDKLNIFSSNMMLHIGQQNSKAIERFNQRLKSHVNFQRARLLGYRELYDLLLALKNKIKFKNILQKENGSISNRVFGIFLTYPFELCAEYLTEYHIVRALSNRSMKDAISTNCIQTVENGMPIYKPTLQGKQIYLETKTLKSRLINAEKKFLESTKDDESEVLLLNDSFDSMLRLSNIDFTPQYTAYNAENNRVSVLSTNTDASTDLRANAMFFR